MALSPKQIDSLKRSSKRINIWEGSVRSGKSFVALLRFIQALRDAPKGQAMIVGPSRDSIQRNIVSALCEWLPMKVPTPKATQLHLYGRTVHLVGAADERAQRRIQGSTLALAYVDELSLLPEGFFRMLLSRLSVAGAQIFATTNPDSPYHWVKKEFLDRENELDLVSFPFRLDDNPSLDPSYVANLKSEYTGMWYDRYIEGKWVMAEGLVYAHFDEKEHVIEAPPSQGKEYVVGVDYGTTNPTVFLMIGYNPHAWPNVWVEKEYFFDSAKEMYHKTDTDYAEDLEAFCEGYPVAGLYVDPSATSFRMECERHDIPNLYEADNDVLSGIRFVAQYLANGTLKICDSAQSLIREMGAYAWDIKASARGIDRPSKKHDHACDALRYALFSHFAKGGVCSYSSFELDTMYNESRGDTFLLPPPFSGHQMQGVPPL